MDNNFVRRIKILEFFGKGVAVVFEISSNVVLGFGVFTAVFLSDGISVYRYIIEFLSGDISQSGKSGVIDSDE